jgi:hypothetical protein
LNFLLFNAERDDRAALAPPLKWVRDIRTGVGSEIADESNHRASKRRQRCLGRLALSIPALTVGGQDKRFIRGRYWFLSAGLRTLA